MKIQQVKQIIKEEIQNVLSESHQPGEEVLYKGTVYIVDKEEGQHIYLIDKANPQRKIRVIYRDFKNQPKPFQNPIFNPLHENTRISINTITNLIKGLSEEELLKVIKFINTLSKLSPSFLEPDIKKFPKSVGGR
jgi:hypothetical protein